MDEFGNLVYQQPNYSLLARKKFWSIDYAVKLITIYHLRDGKYKKAEDGKRDFYAFYDVVISIVKEAISSSDLAINIVSNSEGDGGGTPNLKKSKISPINFVVWAVRRGLPVPEGFKEILPYYNASQPVANGVAECSDRLGGDGTAHSLAIDIPKAKAAKIIDAAFHAVLACFNHEPGTEMTDDGLSSHVARKMDNRIEPQILQLICERLPEEIRTVALPLEAKKKRHYGILAKKDEQVGMAISATAEIFDYLNSLKGGKINQDDLYVWLARQGYKTLTDVLLDLIWQAVPPRYKKPSKEKML